MSDAKMYGTVDSSWDLLDGTMENASTVNEQTKGMCKATAALNLALDQRSVSLAKQNVDDADDMTTVNSVMPKWPVASMHHTYPSMSRNDQVERAEKSETDRPISARAGRTKPYKHVRFKDDQVHANRTKHRHVAESMGGRVTRCLRGIGYDLNHWSDVEPGHQSSKLRYILTRDDRTPISIGFLVVIVVFIVVLISLCCTKRKPAFCTDPRLAARLMQMDPAQQARFYMLMNSCH